MRNPAPIILGLLLAAAAAYFILNKPAENPADDPKIAATPPEEAPMAAQNPAEEAPVNPETPEPAATDPVTEEVAARPWPQSQSDIPTDPNAIFGSLPNGLRYIILPNAEPPDRVSIRLHIAAGSLMEADNQRGLAHFLEHMVFNGSKNFTPDELIPQMQRLGIAFGAHVNAYTSFEETVYMLDLPDLSDEMLGLGFTVMRDFGDGAMLKIEEIDKERGVILSEKTSRDSVGYRMMEKQFASILPNSRVTERFPIGQEEVIRNAPRERFTEFYEQFYTPERMTFVVVGDIDPAAIEKRIKESFGSMSNPLNPGQDPEMGELSSPEGLEPAVFTDKELTSTELGLLAVEPYSKQPDTSALRISKMPLSVANSILGQRFDRLSKQEGSPIIGGSASRSELFNHVELGSIDIQVADDRWEDALPILEQEFRRAVEYGFTEAELVEAKANILNSYEQAVKSKESRSSDGLATAIARSISSGRVLTDPDTDLSIIKSGLESVDRESCHEAFAKFWKDKGRHLILTTKEAADGSLDKLVELYETSSKTEIEAPIEKAVQEFAYTDFGSEGEIDKREDIEGLGITRITLKNGTVVNLKPTDFDKNSIFINVRIGHGKLSQPEDQEGISDFATAVIEGGGIGEHSVDDLQQIFAGKNIGFGFGVGEESFSLSGQTTPEDLELQLQAMAAQMINPGYKEEGVSQFRKGIPMLFQQLKHTPSGPMNEMSRWLRGGDSRFSMPAAPDPLMAFEIDDVKPWLSDTFSDGTAEVSIVGDFDPETAINAVRSTFGALSDRKPASPLASSLREVEFPEAPQTKTFTYQSKIPQGQSIVIWKTPGIRGNEEVFRRLSLLGNILGDRLREEIREKLGASYSPRAGASGSTALEDFGYLIAMSTGKPEDIENISAVTVALAEKLSEEGATEDDFERAMKPILADLKKTLRDNAYWLNSVLSGSSEDPRKFELARNRIADFESITLKEINDLAKSYLGEDNAIQILIKPEDSADSGE